MAKSGAQSLTFKKRDEETEKQADRQTDRKLNVFGRRAPPNIEHVYAPPKRLAM